MLTIWGRSNSSNVQKVMWAVSEIGVPVKRIDAGGAFGRTDEPSYRAKNPNGLVPTLEEDDGFILWESNSILRYLGDAYDPNGVLRPKDTRTRAKASQWVDWDLAVLWPAHGAAFVGLVRTPEHERDHKAIEASLEKTTAALMMVEAQLSRTAFMAGDDFSYGDIPIGIVTRRYREFYPARPSMPNLDRWFAAIAKRKGYQDGVGNIPLT